MAGKKEGLLKQQPVGRPGDQDLIPAPVEGAGVPEILPSVQERIERARHRPGVQLDADARLGVNHEW